MIAFPLLGVLINLFLGRFIGRKGVVWVACSAMFLAFVAAVSNVYILLTKTSPETREVVDYLFTWISVGEVQSSVSLLMDPLSMVMCLVITGVGFLIHLYSAGYMEHDESNQRYFTYLNLLTLNHF